MSQITHARPGIMPLPVRLQLPHLPALDGLRAVAVAVVVAYHLGAPISGDLGVTGFFVLSGFLITRLLLAELGTTGTLSLRRFYLRRTLRIFPAYYAFVATSLLVDLLLGHPWPPLLLAAAFGYGMNYFNAFHGHDGPIAHAWSLAVEEQFYLLWPLALIGLRGLPPGRLARSLVGLVFAVVVWRSWCYLGLETGSAYVYNAFDTRMDSLALGCLLAVLLREQYWQGLMEGLLRRAWLPTVTLALLALSRGKGSLVYHYTVGFTVDALLLAIFLVQMLTLAEHPAWRWLDWPFTRWLGRISYPIYLWHQVGIRLGGKLPLPAWAEASAGVLFTIGLAAGSYYLLERPVLGVVRR